MYGLANKISTQRIEKAHERSLCMYLCCSWNCGNLTILILLQAFSASSLGLLWFEYDYLHGMIFEHAWIASTSYFLGCLMSGIFLSKMSASRIKSLAGRVRHLRCVFITTSSITVVGSCLLICLNRLELSQGYIEVILFIE